MLKPSTETEFFTDLALLSLSLLLYLKRDSDKGVFLRVLRKHFKHDISLTELLRRQ